MPPKQKVTADMVIKAAYDLTREQGIAAVNARRVAKLLGCSTQPVFSCFPTMEALKKAVFDHAAESCMGDILAGEGKTSFAADTSMWVVRLAREEPHIFHLLYLSDSFEKKKLLDTMLDYECNRKLLERMAATHGLTEAESRDVYLRGYLLLHGIATMIATNHMAFTDGEISDLIGRTVRDMVRGIKEARA